MKQYYLICDECGHYKFLESAPQNRKIIVLIIALSDQQKKGLEDIMNEKNNSLELLITAAKMRQNQKVYSNLVNTHELQLKTSLSVLDTENQSKLLELLEREVKKASDKIELSKIASDSEKEFDTALSKHERNYGKVYQKEDELTLF